MVEHSNCDEQPTKKSSRETPRTPPGDPKSSPERSKNRSVVHLRLSGVFRGSSGTPRERWWTLSGRSRALPGHSLDAPEALFGCTGALPGRLGESSMRVRTRFSSGMDTDPIFRRFLFDVSMKIRLILSNNFWMIVDRSTMLSWCQQGCTISKKH